VAGCSAKAIGGSTVEALECQVQGGIADADEMERKIHWVLAVGVPEHLNALTDDDLTKFKRSFREQLEAKPTSTHDEFFHWWAPTVDGSFCFSQLQTLEDALETQVTKQSLVEAWQQAVMPTAADAVRKTAVVKYFPKQPSPHEPAQQWDQEGLPQSYVQLLERERSTALVLDRADSVVRAKLLEGDGKYFPEDIHCGPRSASQTTTTNGKAAGAITHPASGGGPQDAPAAQLLRREAAAPSPAEFLAVSVGDAGMFRKHRIGKEGARLATDTS